MPRDDRVRAVRRVRRARGVCELGEQVRVGGRADVAAVVLPLLRHDDGRAAPAEARDDAGEPGGAAARTPADGDTHVIFLPRGK